MINVIQCKNKCYKARDTHGVRTLFGLHPAFLKTLLHPPPPRAHHFNQNDQKKKFTSSLPKMTL
jgi:hypothetical protein